MMKIPAEKSILRRKLGMLPGSVTAIIWLVVFPLWQGGSYSHITSDKWKCMLVLTVVTMFLTGCYAIAGRFYSSEDDTSGAFRPGIPQIFAVLYFLWVCLSALYGAYHGQLNAEGQKAVLLGARRYEGLLTQLCYFVIFFCLSIQKLPVRTAANAAATGMLLYFAVVLCQYRGFNPFGLFPNGLSVKTNPSFQGTIGNMDVVSGYVVLITAFLWGSFVSMKKGGWLCLAGGLAGVMLALFMEVQSGIIAFAVGIVLLLTWMLTDGNIRFRGWLILTGTVFCLIERAFLVLPWEAESGKVEFGRIARNHLLLFAVFFLLCAGAAFRYYRKGKTISTKKAIAVLLLVVVLSTAAFAFFPLQEKNGGIWELQQTLKGEPEDYFGSWRFGVWRITLELIRKYPLFGTGPDTFYYAFNPIWKEYEEYLRTEKGFSSTLQLFDTPHNEYLAIMSNNGIPALILYLCLMGAVLHNGVIKVKRHKEAAGLLTAVVLFMLQGFFSFSICLVTPMFWFILGMTAQNKYPTEV